ncbi:TonB-dependent receptor [Verminephrobacter aporrectodeae]|uniref:TonB-dependent receptor n=1 Tax=Verminephrobacter aporrectodeae TaxID=1110389 RepID=UPI002244505A|nr:TonB-dependent receptor [Verminephrobacter aporrectodeae]
MNVQGVAALAAVLTGTGVVPKLALADTTGGDVRELGAVTVTAQKVEQNVLDVPATVEVVGAEDLALHQIDSLEDLDKLVSGLGISSYTGGQPRIYLRGMGDAFDLKNKRVAVYVDGVPQIDSVLQDRMLLDHVERVEVLKGPQGTLYGRNASAGVINIVTKRLRGDAASAFLGAGNHDQRRGGATLSKSLAEDQMLLGINASWTRRNGVLENVATGSRGKLDGQERRNLHLKADLYPTDKTALNLTFSHFEDDSAPYLQTFIDPTTWKPIRRDAGRGFVPVRFYQIDRDTEGHTKTRGNGLTLRVSHDFDLFRLNSITGYQQDKLHTVSDADYSSNPLFKWDFDPYTNEHKQLSQEFQLVGNAGAAHWQTGVFAYGDQTDNSNAFKTSYGNIFSNSRYRTRGVAWYGQLDYVFVPGWTATAGGRYQRDRQKLKDFQQDREEVSKSKSSSTYKLALAYAFQPDNTTFLSYGTGYTPGGVNTSPQMIGGLPVGPYLSYAPEKTSSIEWGIKGRLAGQRLGYSLSLYHTLLRNQQVLDMADTQMKNIGETRYRGVEMSADYQIAGPWNLNAGYALNTSRIRKSSDPAELGKSVPFVPGDTGRIGVQYKDRIADTPVTVRLDMNHVGRIKADAKNSFSQSSYQLFSLSGKADFKHWWLSLSVNNLLDKQYYSNAIANSPLAGTHTAVYGQPRTVLLTLGSLF